jgi:hypothetical protein
MAELFANGRVVELVLILAGIELVCLVGYWTLTQRGVSPAVLLPNLCAGIFLLLALRLVLAGVAWEYCCGCLAAAGFAHVADLRQRWRG